MGMRPKDTEEVIAGTSKSKTFRTVSAKTAEAGERGELITGFTEKLAGHSAGLVTESKSPPVELEDLLLKLEQIKKSSRASSKTERKRKEKSDTIKLRNLTTSSS